ncbi:NAD(P)/FAD-dependent oxidoreductase [Thermopolyspora sp. NPDC052614]|uniref:flavin-containing monooxygenase n=1 Tax=Thermopolyspora sp. NPDC052614 TaxID=3155682 RepID=UPI003448B6C7
MAEPGGGGAGPVPEHAGIVIIGSGFAGLGMAIRLKDAGYHDFVVLEKAGRLGGTWRDNSYPGCSCDVPSYLYSFSFALHPGWTQVFSPQREIWDYLEWCADRYGVRRHIRFGREVAELEYDDARRRWRVVLAGGQVVTANAVVAGFGALHVPSYPDIPGRERFTGPAFHSARWDHSQDLTGKRVAVIGTGASAIQFIPEIAARAGRLTVFQRTAPWVQPRPDRATSPRLRRLLRTVPLANRALRIAIYWGLELRGLGFTVHPRLMRRQAETALRYLERQVPDPRLRARLTPGYGIGCKRILLSSVYYPALQRDNVELVTDRVTEIRERSILDAGGREHEVDVIVYGTGFKVTESLAELRITGRGGRKIQDAWRDRVEAYLGTTVAGFPNLFFLSGPNTGLGHTSVVFMMEAQTHYILECLRLLSRTGARALDVRPGAQREFNRRLRRRLDRRVWSTGGCRSWYLDGKGGNPTIWPGTTAEFWARTRRVRRRAYELIR